MIPWVSEFGMNVSMADRDKCWFGPYRFGYGWGPVAWQGWVIVAFTVIVSIVMVKSFFRH